MDAAELRRQLRSILQDDVYPESPAGDQDFLEDFELIVREYRLAKEHAALERIRAAHYTSPKRRPPERDVALPWLDGVKKA